MKPTIYSSSNPSIDARRAQVRRLFLRHKLSMGQIARQLGVSKPTVMRDLRWWQQQEEEHPKTALEALNQEIEDAKTEAWYAYARSLEPREVETETISTPSEDAAARADKKDAAATGRHNVKRVRTSGAGDWRYLNLIAALIEKQVKLFHGEQSEEEDTRPPVVVYLPDNGRGPNPWEMEDYKSGKKKISDWRPPEDVEQNQKERDARARESSGLATGGARPSSVPAAPEVTSADNAMKADVTICNGSETAKLPNIIEKPTFSGPVTNVA